MVCAMSAIVSLLRVMTLRDAEAITLEAGKVPALRRRGQVEALAMPALEGKLLDDFAAPLIDGKQLDGPMMVTFVDGDGTTYPVTVERVASGLKLIVKKPAPPKPAPKPAPPAPSPAAAKPAPAKTEPVASMTADDA